MTSQLDERSVKSPLVFKIESIFGYVTSMTTLVIFLTPKGTEMSKFDNVLDD